MDQKELRELEARCIQEEPPPCTARCPIHVDVRLFLKKAAQADWDGALEVLAATMPFPRILARICDHPCEEDCRRAEAGGALSISGIEKIAVMLGRIKKAPPESPRKDARVAIAGTTLSGLTAAWDLAHKGYQVTLFGRFGESLREMLPSGVIEEEREGLKRLGVEIRPIPQTKDPELYNLLLAGCDAVYLALDPEDSFFDEPVDPSTLMTSLPGLFAGYRRSSSPILNVSEGRRAATSIDRYLQKVSLTAGREHEGSFESKLFTNLAGLEPQSRVPMEDPAGYNEAEAMSEAGRCIQCQCLECVKSCRYLERFKSYPKTYIRQIYNNEAILIGSHGLTNKLINSCSLCGLCEVVCPNHLSMAPVCLEGRMNLVQRNKMPPSAHDFALEEMRAANSEKSVISCHEPGRDRSAYAFFPGCQMGATYPDHVLFSYAYLRKTLNGGVGLMLRCCGAPAAWAGRSELFEDSLHTLLTEWEALGSPTLIVACPTCYRMLKDHLPDGRLTTLWQVIDEPLPKHAVLETLAIHDPCTSRHEPAMQQSIRNILTRMGYGIEELDLSAERTECCGFGGLMSTANPSLAKEVAEVRGSRSGTDYVTYCAMCRNALAASGKRVLHILDLLFGSEKDPAGRRVPGLSERRENRYRLKERLLRELWGRERPVEEYERIILCLSPKIQHLMEERRILAEDIKKVIDYGERSGKRFFNAELNHWLASFRPGHITYWVEYSCGEEGFIVHTIYSHRMEVREGP